MTYIYKICSLPFPQQFSPPFLLLGLGLMLPIASMLLQGGYQGHIIGRYVYIANMSYNMSYYKNKILAIPLERKYWLTTHTCILMLSISFKKYLKLSMTISIELVICTERLSDSSTIPSLPSCYISHLKFRDVSYTEKKLKTSKGFSSEEAEHQFCAW